MGSRFHGNDGLVGSGRARGSQDREAGDGFPVSSTGQAPISREPPPTRGQAPGESGGGGAPGNEGWGVLSGTRGRWGGVV